MSVDFKPAATERQRSYYDQTSPRYDAIHSHDVDEHAFAFAYMLSMIDFLGVESVLDVGSGTGFALMNLKQRRPGLAATGVEPSAAQRAAGYSKGLSQTELVEGNAMQLAFADRSFDLVCEFGALHHMPRPDLAVGEMLRVARKAIFVCDTNGFGQGGAVARFVKQAINAVGLWPLANLIKTRGKGYSYAEGDGVMYSYSVFNDHRQIARQCSSVHLLNLTNASPNLYASASHVAVLGILRGADFHDRR
jgi:ubiquinone/menaquinone biosynthesis C-methylase UbiE